MEEKDLFLILGCFGFTDGSFVNCSSVENKILKIDPTLEKYGEIVNYLDNCRLFDRPLFDFNSVKNVIQNIHVKYDQVASPKRMWQQRDVDNFEKFIMTHRRCGLYLKLALVSKSGIINNKPEENSIFIEGKAKEHESLKKVKLTLLRGGKRGLDR